MEGAGQCANRPAPSARALSGNERSVKYRCAGFSTSGAYASTGKDHPHGPHLRHDRGYGVGDGDEMSMVDDTGTGGPDATGPGYQERDNCME